MFTSNPSTPAPVWRLQDAKAQFSARVDKALLGVPQHVTRSGKPAVVVLSEQDFEACNKAPPAAWPQRPPVLLTTCWPCQKAAADEESDLPRLDVTPRAIDFS